MPNTNEPVVECDYCGNYVPESEIVRCEVDGYEIDYYCKECAEHLNIV